MEKIAVIYKSKRGSTKQYAQWIAEETGADLFNVENCSVEALADYDTLVFGGWVRGGGIQGLDFLKKNWKLLKSKHVIAFAVGLNVHEAAAQAECKEVNFIKTLEGIPCYFFRGAYDPATIAGIEKAIMGLVRRFVPKDSQLGRDLENGADYVSREQITELLDVLR